MPKKFYANFESQKIQIRRYPRYLGFADFFIHFIRWDPTACAARGDLNPSEVAEAFFPIGEGEFTTPVAFYPLYSPEVFYREGTEEGN